MFQSVLLSSVGRGRVASIVNTPLPPLPRMMDQLRITISDNAEEEADDIDNCYHEVIIGDSGTKIAPPLPPRAAVKTPSPLNNHNNDNYTTIIPPTLPSRQSSCQGSPPPLMRKLSGLIDVYFFLKNV